MADKKISALTGATTPLAGTEVLPIVQGGSTVKVSVANLTAGRETAASKFAAKIGTSGTYYRLYEIQATGGSAIGEISYNDTNDTMRIANLSNYVNTSMTFYVNAADRMEIMPNGNIKALNGNVVMSTAGKGIDFSANGGDVLTQYDEGTWNVNWNNLTGTPTSTVGRYTRIGRMVFFTYNTGAGAISGTGNSVSFSLPFTPAYASVGAMIASNVSSAGNILIWTGSLAYPETFSGSEMVFSGSFYV